MRLGDRPYLRPRSSAVMLIYGSITPQLVQTEARSSLIRELRLWSWELRQHADVCECVSMRGCVCAFNIGLNFLCFLLLSKHGTQRGQERTKFPDCLWTSSDRTIIICFVHSDACILQSLTRIKPLPMSEPCRTGGSEEGGEREKDGGERGKKKTQHRQQSWERSLHWYLTITCLLFLCHFHVNYREKPLRFMCSVFLPFSLLPFIMSYTRLAGAVISLLHRTLVYLEKNIQNNEAQAL